VSKVNLIDVTPRVLVELIAVIPAIWLNCFSRGVATDDAISSGLAPGRAALTVIADKSTGGKEATGRNLNATMPASVNPEVSKAVATGLFIKTEEMFMPAPRC
jgi:hypothetical protein